MLKKPQLPLSEKLPDLRTALDTFFEELSRELGRSSMAGQIVLWPTDTFPEGWVECDGTDYGTQFPEIYASSLGGVVPDLTASAPAGTHYIIKVS